MRANSNNRDLKFDIARGILIILVVFGHSGTTVKDYIFWFHMPAFFMLSGVFYRKVATIKDWKAASIKVLFSLGVPYLCYLLVLNVYQIGIYISQHDVHSLGGYLYKLVYGGRAVGNQNAVFWFITVLIITRLLVSFLNLFFSDRAVVWITIVLFVIGTCESLAFHILHKHPKVPLNADVVLVSSFFYYLGYYLKPYLIRISLWVVILSTLIYAALIVLGIIGFLSHKIDIKTVLYYNPVFFIVIPLLCFIIVIYISNKIKDIPYISNSLAYVGENSLSIMYLHIGVNLLLLNYFHLHYGVLLFTVVGVCVPVLFEKLVRTNKVTRLLFIGK